MQFKIGDRVQHKSFKINRGDKETITGKIVDIVADGFGPGHEILWEHLDRPLRHNYIEYYKISKESRKDYNIRNLKNLKK